MDKLKLVVEILHKIDIGADIDTRDYADNLKEFLDVVEAMEHDGLIFGTKVKRAVDSGVVFFERTKLTIKGMHYLRVHGPHNQSLEV